jgi:competence protein ComEC
MPSLLLSESRYPRGLSHRVPLLLPGILGVWGATYPACALKIAVSAGLIGLLALAARRVALATRGEDVRGTSHAGPIARAPLILSAVCLLLGIWRGQVWETRIRVVGEHASPGHQVDLTVIPVQEPEPLPYGSGYSFRAVAKSSAAPHAGWFGVLASCYPSHLARLTPGSSVECRAVLELPSPAMNPGGFDYRGYLLGDRVVALAEIEDVVGPGRMTPSPLFIASVKASAAFRRYMTRALQSTFPAGDAAVLKAVFLGDRSDLLPEDTRNFKRSGFYRFVGIAGFHVDLLFVLTEKSLRRITKRPSFSRAVALLSAYCYGSLSGWSAGALRAVVSGSMRVLAPAVRRKYHPLAGLGASAIAIMWAVPFPLMNTGFLLSCGGTLGAWLGWVYAEILLARKAHRLAVSLVRPVTMCLVLFPVMALCFTEVSLVSFALSGIWGSIAALMVPVAALTSFIPPLGTIFGWVPHILLEGTRALSGLLSSVPVAGMTVPSPGLHEIAAYWALLALPLTVAVSTGAVRGGEEASAFFRRRRALSALRRVVLFCSAAVLLISAIIRVYAPVPEVTFLYVGQGDCAVVRHGSAVMMVDTGTATAFGSHILPYLKAKGVSRIDLCVISHLHADHAGGLPALCAEMTVGLVAVPPGFRDQAKSLIEEGGRVQAGTVPKDRIPPVIELHPGLRYRWGGGAVLDVIAPEPGSFLPGTPTNESSAGFVLNLGSLEVEFWGDLPSASIAAAMDVCRQVPAPGDPPRVVKVPHHGSADAFVPALYERIGMPAGTTRETISIISVGANPYGHPSNRVEEAARGGGRLFRTDEAGAVTVRASFGRVLVTPFLP